MKWRRVDDVIKCSAMKCRMLSVGGVHSASTEPVCVQVVVTSCSDSSVEWQLAIGAPLLCEERDTLERGVVPMLVDIGASLLLHVLGHREALHMSLHIE
jgi:hypothetical protein